MSRILVTGAAGFIGFHLVRRLLRHGHQVTGFDNLNDYYDVSLKEARLTILKGLDGFAFVRGALEERSLLEKMFQAEQFDYVINLAAQAGVRYSLQNPHAYIDSNISGFLNILEGAARLTSSIWCTLRQVPCMALMPRRRFQSIIQLTTPYRSTPRPSARTS